MTVRVLCTIGKLRDYQFNSSIHAIYPAETDAFLVLLGSYRCVLLETRYLRYTQAQQEYSTIISNYCIH